MTFKIEKVGNMIFVVSDCNTIFKAWDERDFTEKKLQNTMKKIQNNLKGNAVFVRTF